MQGAGQALWQSSAPWVQPMHRRRSPCIAGASLWILVPAALRQAAVRLGAVVPELGAQCAVCGTERVAGQWGFQAAVMASMPQCNKGNIGDRGAAAAAADKAFQRQVLKAPETPRQIWPSKRPSYGSVQ